MTLLSFSMACRGSFFLLTSLCSAVNTYPRFHLQVNPICTRVRGREREREGKGEIGDSMRWCWAYRLSSPLSQQASHPTLLYIPVMMVVRTLDEMSWVWCMYVEWWSGCVWCSNLNLMRRDARLAYAWRCATQHCNNIKVMASRRQVSLSSMVYHLSHRHVFPTFLVYSPSPCYVHASKNTPAASQSWWEKDMEISFYLQYFPVNHFESCFLRQHWFNQNRAEKLCLPSPCTHYFIYSIHY